MKLFLTVPALFILSLIACNKSEDKPIVTNLPYSFQDGFESADNNIDDLFVSDGSRWSNIQRVNPDNGENQIELNQTIVNEGNSSLRIFSQPSDNTLSKIDIEKGGFFAPIGSTIIVEADFYINADGNLKELFLIDLECCSCWDSSVSDNQCPGVRLKMSGDNNYLSIERGKILGSTISHTALSFPKNEWVNVRWEMTLSPDQEAENKLTINQQEVINESGKNLPNKEEFRSEFALNGIDFELQEPLGYERIQIGATANPTQFGVELFIDNFKLEIQ